MAGLFEQHDREKFEVSAISFGPDTRSELRSRLVSSFETFLDARTKSNEEVVSLLRKFEFDIVVDLMGFTGDFRFELLAYRPAAIQVNYLGYPGTMGLAYMDYIIADEFVIPRSEQHYYSEKVIYLPDCFQANDSKRKIGERTPPRIEAGLPESGFVFCCFNNSYKIKPEVFDVWMRILTQVEHSVLWLLGESDTAMANLRREAQSRGVKPDRLVFAKRVKTEDYLARYRLANLFLDTLPFNAGTTASDVLWAGLPLVTCSGAAFAARMAGSLLHAVGLPELVTHSLEDYEALILKLATDQKQLREVNEKLARNRLAKPLFNTDRFRQHIEAAYTTMWEIHQRGEEPRNFTVVPID
jgi:predicted O-linked N-acetylglucosamine transferase (SPINDLY family)